MSKTVFVATTFDKAGKGNPVIDFAEKSGWTVLHPLFNWNHPQGAEALARLGCSLKDLPVDENKWNQILERDYWAIAKSDYLVYDLERNPGEHFLSAAVSRKVPIVLVSDFYSGLPYSHFAGYCRVCCSAKDLPLFLGLLAASDELARTKASGERKKGAEEAPGKELGES